MSIEEKLKHVLRQADLKSRLIRGDVKYLELPENPSAWLEWYEQYAESLPDDLPQKEYILRYIQIARGQLANEDTSELRVWMSAIQKNCENAGHDKWVIGVEKQYAETAKKRNHQQRPINEARWKKWKDEAARVAEKMPSIASIKIRLARHVKRNLNCSESVETIRRRI